jgi:pimeloyl-ACP methyl ester carboxylesterase
MTSRRNFLGAVAALAALVPGAGAKPVPAARPKQYLLVHGTGHGGWCWRGVSDILTRAGHRVFTPTLTGLGERSHLRSPEIGLDTHIDDVTNVAIWEELDDFILVGHSYGGYVITGVCDRLRGRVGHAVYIDAPDPKDGASNSHGRSIEQLAQAMGPLIDGYLYPVNDGSIALLGIPPADRKDADWLRRRLTPHPLKTWTDAIHLVNGGSDGLPRTYVFCNAAPPDSPLARNAEKMRGDPSWIYKELPCGHDAMVILPEQTAAILAAVEPGIGAKQP